MGMSDSSIETGGSGPWRRRGPWIAGVALCGVGVAALFSGSKGSSPSRFFQGFPQTAGEGDLAGMGETPRSPEAQARVMDSFAMLPRSGGSEGPASPSPSASPSTTKSDPSFIDALQSIADKKQTPANPTTFPGRIQAMASGFFGSSGGGSPSGGGLSAPKSDSLVKVSRPGAGAAPMVPRERDFRAAYGEGGGTPRRSGAAPGGALASMASPASGGSASAGRSMGGMPQGPSASAAGPGGGGSSSMTPPATPPPTGAGKGLQPLDLQGKPTDAKAAGSSSSNSAGSSAASSIGSALGSALGSSWGRGGSGGQASSERLIPTGVSRYGLVGDARNGNSWAGSLGTAGASPNVSAGTLATAPSYNANAALSGAEAQRSQLMEYGDYKPSGVTDIVSKAKGVPTLKQPEPKTGLFDGIDQTKFDKLGQVEGANPTDRAVALVLEARKAAGAAYLQAGKYRETLQTEAGRLSDLSGTAQDSSKAMADQKNTVEQLETSLTRDLRGQVQQQAQAWQTAASRSPPDTPGMQNAVNAAQRAMGDYGNKADDAFLKGDRLAEKLDKRAVEAERTQTVLRRDLSGAKDEYAKALTAFDRSISSLRSEIAKAGSSFSGEGSGSQGRKMVSNGVGIVQELNAQRQTLLKAQSTYSQTAADLDGGTKAVVGVYRGKGR